jgi:Ni/Fe-hydrogenase subunit HybB-like protein
MKGNVLDYRRSDERCAWQRSAIPPTFLALGGFCVVMILIPIITARTPGPSLATRVRNETSLISTALEAHRREQGSYPASLNALAPSYLPRMPTVTTWTYTPTADGCAFTLSCVAGTTPITISGGEQQR